MKPASRPSTARVIRLLALTLLTGVMFAQTTNKTPGKGTASIQTALDEAKDALKHYKTALAVSQRFAGDRDDRPRRLASRAGKQKHS